MGNDQMGHTLVYDYSLKVGNSMQTWREALHLVPVLEVDCSFFMKSPGRRERPHMNILMIWPLWPDVKVTMTELEFTSALSYRAHI